MSIASLHSFVHHFDRSTHSLLSPHLSLDPCAQQYTLLVASLAFFAFSLALLTVLLSPMQTAHAAELEYRTAQVQLTQPVPATGEQMRKSQVFRKQRRRRRRESLIRRVCCALLIHVPIHVLQSHRSLAN